MSRCSDEGVVEPALTDDFVAVIQYKVYFGSDQQQTVEPRKTKRYSVEPVLDLLEVSEAALSRGVFARPAAADSLVPPSR